MAFSSLSFERVIKIEALLQIDDLKETFKWPSLFPRYSSRRPIAFGNRG